MDFTYTKIFEINFSIANTSLNLQTANGQWSPGFEDLLLLDSCLLDKYYEIQHLLTIALY